MQVINTNGELAKRFEAAYAKHKAKEAEKRAEEERAAQELKEAKLEIFNRLIEAHLGINAQVADCCIQIDDLVLALIWKSTKPEPITAYAVRDHASGYFVLATLAGTEHSILLGHPAFHIWYIESRKTPAATPTDGEQS